MPARKHRQDAEYAGECHALLFLEPTTPDDPSGQWRAYEQRDGGQPWEYYDREVIELLHSNPQYGVKLRNRGTGTPWVPTCEGSGQRPASSGQVLVRGSGGVVRPGTRGRCASCDRDVAVTPSGLLTPHGEAEPDATVHNYDHERGARAGGFDDLAYGQRVAEILCLTAMIAVASGHSDRAETIIDTTTEGVLDKLHDNDPALTKTNTWYDGTRARISKMYDDLLTQVSEATELSRTR